MLDLSEHAVEICAVLVILYVAGIVLLRYLWVKEDKSLLSYVAAGLCWLVSPLWVALLPIPLVLWGLGKLLLVEQVKVDTPETPPVVEPPLEVPPTQP